MGRCTYLCRRAGGNSLQRLFRQARVGVSDEAPIKRHRFGVETGANGLIKEGDYKNGCNSAAEVVVAWELAHGLVTIPSSTKRKNLETNFKALGLTLDAEDVAHIDALDCGDRQATPDFAPEWD